MIDRRDVIKLMAVGAVGIVMAGGETSVPVGAPDRADELMRFSIEGDMGRIRASSALESIQVDGHFAERAVFMLHQ